MRGQGSVTAKNDNEPTSVRAMVSGPAAMPVSPRRHLLTPAHTSRAPVAATLAAILFFSFFCIPCFLIPPFPAISPQIRRSLGRPPTFPLGTASLPHAGTVKGKLPPTPLLPIPTTSAPHPPPNPRSPLLLNISSTYFPPLPLFPPHQRTDGNQQLFPPFHRQPESPQDRAHPSQLLSSLPLSATPSYLPCLSALHSCFSRFPPNAFSTPLAQRPPHSICIFAVNTAITRPPPLSPLAPVPSPQPTESLPPSFYINSLAAAAEHAFSFRFECSLRGTKKTCAPHDAISADEAASPIFVASWTAEFITAWVHKRHLSATICAEILNSNERLTAYLLKLGTTLSYQRAGQDERAQQCAVTLRATAHAPDGTLINLETIHYSSFLNILNDQGVDLDHEHGDTIFEDISRDSGTADDLSTVTSRVAHMTFLGGAPTAVRLLGMPPTKFDNGVFIRCPPPAPLTTSHIALLNQHRAELVSPVRVLPLAATPPTHHSAHSPPPEIPPPYSLQNSHRHSGVIAIRVRAYYADTMRSMRGATSKGFKALFAKNGTVFKATPTGPANDSSRRYLNALHAALADCFSETIVSNDDQGAKSPGMIALFVKAELAAAGISLANMPRAIQTGNCVWMLVPAWIEDFSALCKERCNLVHFPNQPVLVVDDTAVAPITVQLSCHDLVKRISAARQTTEPTAIPAAQRPSAAMGAPTPRPRPQDTSPLQVYPTTQAPRHHLHATHFPPPLHHLHLHPYRNTPPSPHPTSCPLPSPHYDRALYCNPRRGFLDQGRHHLGCRPGQGHASVGDIIADEAFRARARGHGDAVATSRASKGWRFVLLPRVVLFYNFRHLLTTLSLCFALHNETTHSTHSLLFLRFL